MLKEDFFMVENEKKRINDCNFANIRPAMTDLPYPSIQVKDQNQIYANLLSLDYCGSVSEMSAITQYINNENRMSSEECPLAKMILGIAMAEMIHLQKLGQLIYLLGGKIDFVARQPNGRQNMWNPSYLTIPENVQKMILADIESEKAAIQQYKMHMNVIKDSYVNAVLARIVKDEEYHITLLKAMLEMCK